MSYYLEQQDMEYKITFSANKKLHIFHFKFEVIELLDELEMVQWQRRGG
jgi:hypothetical protein